MEVCMADIIETLKAEMIRFDKGDAKRIQHFLKVHSLSRLIATEENMDAHDLLVLESATLLHDIGIHPAEEKYGSCNGKLQEQEGPAPAREILTRLDYKEEDIERICYMIAHHHTYTGINTAELQILIESDFLVNLFEDGSSADTIRNVEKNIFRTESGKRLLEEMFF